MSTESEAINRLSVDEVPQVDLPQIPWVPLPDKLVSAFKDLEDWQTQQQAALEEWRQTTNYILRRAD